MTYNGWKNYETWNVALWVSNDVKFYFIAKEQAFEGYESFVQTMRDLDILETPDEVSWTDSALDIPALDELLNEL